MNDKVSRAREFFDQIKTAPNPAAFLNDMVTKKKSETDFLEFKGASKISDQQVKEYWSQALSGFANTEGGVLIWGIRADKIADPADPSRKIDAASSLDLVPVPLSFLQLLKDVRLEATIDPVPGIDYVHYENRSGGTEGFVVCMVPESSQKPHRAQLDPKRQYYQRIGDSFVILPHPLLRSLFYPRTRPSLGASIEVTFFGDNNKGCIVFSVSLKNKGTSSARNLVVRVKTDTRMAEGAPATDWEFLKNVRFMGVDFYVFSSRPLHPGQTVRCFSCTFEVANPPPRERSGWFKPPFDEYAFQFLFLMDDQEPQDAVVRFSLDDLKQLSRVESQ